MIKVDLIYNRAWMNFENIMLNKRKHMLRNMCLTLEAENGLKVLRGLKEKTRESLRFRVEVLGKE